MLHLGRPLGASLSLWEKTALAPLNPLPAGGEGRQSIALAGWGSSGLISNQGDMISTWTELITQINNIIY